VHATLSLPLSFSLSLFSLFLTDQTGCAHPLHRAERERGREREREGERGREREREGERGREREGERERDVEYGY
jgi:hypothetical protein